jgi:hypothetical protein
MKGLSFICVLVLNLVSKMRCDGFSPPSIVSSSATFHATRSRTLNPTGLHQLRIQPTRCHQTQLFQSQNEVQVDGTGRGSVFFALVLVGCIWVFSIPTEFRRAHFCFVEQCIQERSKCYDCVTLSEWTTGVQEYYCNGGGVEFDFTVADETKAFWKDAVFK